MKILACSDYWSTLGLKQRRTLQAFWAICIRLSRLLFPLIFSFSSHLSSSLGLCLKAVDQKVKKKNLYRGEILWRINVWLKPLAVFTVHVSPNGNGWKCQIIFKATDIGILVKWRQNMWNHYSFLCRYYIYIMALCWKTCVGRLQEITWVRK